MAYNRSVFPEGGIDTLQEFFDVPPAQKTNVLRYQELKMMSSLTSEQQIELNNLTTTLQDYLITPEHINKFSDICIGLETFFSSEVQGYIDTKQQEMQTEIDKFSDKGTFNPDILYYKNNYVFYNDGTGIKTYLAIQNPPLGTLPTNSTYFRILTITGAKGEDGIGIGLIFKGTWSNSGLYAINEAVQFGGLLFASLINDNIGNQPDLTQDTSAWGIALDVAITTTKLRGQRTIASESNTVNFITGEIIAFNPSVDDLEVIVNTTSPEEGIDYTINIDNQSITKISGTWKVGTTFYFRVIRNMINGLVFSDGQSIALGTIDKTRLSTDVQTTLDNVVTNTQEISVLNGAGELVEKANKSDLDTTNTNLANHIVDYTLQVPFGGTVTNVGNAYSIATPAISTLTTGMAVCLKINADSSGASTLNWDTKGAKGIKKANGADVTNLKANGIYTLRYDGANFILQGEGASGNAIASDLLSGKTAEVDAGDIVGTMIDRGVFNLGLNTPVPAGYYSGGTTANGKAYASGSATSDSNQILTVAGLAFIPRVVFINYLTDVYYVLYRDKSTSLIQQLGTGTYNTQSTMSSSGFSANVYSASLAFTWIAYE